MPVASQQPLDAQDLVVLWFAGRWTKAVLPAALRNRLQAKCQKRQSATRVERVLGMAKWRPSTAASMVSQVVVISTPSRNGWESCGVARGQPLRWPAAPLVSARRAAVTD